MTLTNATDDALIDALRQSLDDVAARVTPDPPELAMRSTSDHGSPRRWVAATAAAAVVFVATGVGVWRLTATDDLDRPVDVSPSPSVSVTEAATSVPTSTTPGTTSVTDPNAQPEPDRLFSIPADIPNIDVSGYVGVFTVEGSGLSVVREPGGKTCYVYARPGGDGAGSTCGDQPHFRGFDWSMDGWGGPGEISVYAHFSALSDSRFIRMRIFLDGQVVCDRDALHATGLPVVSMYECILPTPAVDTDLIIQLTDTDGLVWQLESPVVLVAPEIWIIGTIVDAEGRPVAGITGMSVGGVDPTGAPILPRTIVVDAATGAINLTLKPGNYQLGPSENDSADIANRCDWPQLIIDANNRNDRTIVISCTG